MAPEQVAPGGILEVGDGVEELRHLRRERPLERLDVRPVGLHRDADDRRAVPAKQRERAIVGRRLREHHVAGQQHVQAEELDQLQRAVAGEHPIGADLLPFGEPVAQRLESPATARTAASPRPLRLRTAAAASISLVDRKRLVGGNAAREVDRVQIGVPIQTTLRALVKRVR